MLIQFLIVWSIAHAADDASAVTASTPVCPAALTSTRDATEGAILLLRWLAWDHPLQLRAIRKIPKYAELTGFLSIATGWCLPFETESKSAEHVWHSFWQALDFEVSGAPGADADSLRFARRLLMDRARVGANTDRKRHVARAVFVSLDQIWGALASKQPGELWDLDLRTVDEPESRCVRHLKFKTNVPLTEEDLSELQKLRSTLADPTTRSLAESLYVEFFKSFEANQNYLNKAPGWAMFNFYYQRRAEVVQAIANRHQSEHGVMTSVRAHLFAQSSARGASDHAAAPVERQEAFTRKVAGRFDELPVVTADGLAELQSRMHQAANLLNAQLARVNPNVRLDLLADGRSLDQIQREAEVVSLRHDETLETLRKALSQIDRLGTWIDHVARELANLPADTPRLGSVQRFAQDFRRLLDSSRAAVTIRRDLEHDLAQNVGRLALTLGQHLSTGLIGPFDDDAVRKAIEDLRRSESP